jgi:hypothetical protein
VGTVSLCPGVGLVVVSVGTVCPTRLAGVTAHKCYISLMFFD